MIDRYRRIRSFSAMDTKVERVVFFLFVFLISNWEEPCGIFEQVKLHHQNHVLGI